MSTSPGTMVRADSGSGEAGRIRAERRRRLLDAMADHDLDALVLGQPADVMYATGARQHWRAGSRPFGPACVVVGSTGRAHVLSPDDEGIPSEIAHDDLFGFSWNPATLVASLRSIPGLMECRTVGTGSMSRSFSRMMQGVAPAAEVVDGGPAIWAARATKTGDEVAHIAAAIGVAESGLDAMREALRPGVTERQLLGVYLERIASLGAPNPPSEGVACATPMYGQVQLRRLVTDRPVAAGELVVLDAGAMVAGYEGGVGRTWVVDREPSEPQQALARRCRAALDAVISTCRSGATGAELAAAWIDTGEPLPPVPVVHGIGLGVEPPVIGAGIGAGAVLVAGSVVSVTSWVCAEGVGGCLERDLVLVGGSGPQILSRPSPGPRKEG